MCYEKVWKTSLCKNTEHHLNKWTRFLMLYVSLPIISSGFSFQPETKTLKTIICSAHTHTDLTIWSQLDKCSQFNTVHVFNWEHCLLGNFLPDKKSESEKNIFRYLPPWLYQKFFCYRSKPFYLFDKTHSYFWKNNNTRLPKNIRWSVWFVYSTHYLWEKYF